MPASNFTRRDTYFVGDNAGNAQEGHLWIHSTNNRILIFRGGSWITPGLAGPTFTGTVTTTTISNSGTITTADGTVQSLMITNTLRATGVASLAGTNVNGALTTLSATVASLFIADQVRATGVASLAATNVNGALTTNAGATVASTLTSFGLVARTPAAGAQGFVALGDATVPTVATSTSGFIQMSSLVGTPVGQSAVPTTGTVFLSFDRTRNTLIVNAAGSWFAVPSLFIY